MTSVTLFNDHFEEYYECYVITIMRKDFEVTDLEYGRRGKFAISEEVNYINIVRRIGQSL